jgi:NAD-dependent DNA ligase
MQAIIPPTHCPSCDSPLVWRNDLLYCINSDCESKQLKAIEHWAKTLKIKGLGTQTISKLEITSIPDVYDLTVEYVEHCINSEKLAVKLMEEIEKSKQATLDMVLPAFGIPLIGKTATEKLCKVIRHIDELTKEKAVEAGLGPKAVENLINWYENSYKPLLKENLPFDLKTEARVSIKPVQAKGVVCITGKLVTFKTKAEAEQILVNAGYSVKSSVTKDVTILVNESGIDSAKTVKARESGVQVITNIKELLGE